MSALDTTKTDLTLPTARPPVRRSPPQLPPGLGGPTLPALLRALGRCGRRALALALGGALVTGLALWCCLPQRHAAEVLLQVSAPPRSLLTPGEDAGDLNAYRQAQAASLHSPQLLASALEQPAAALFLAAHGPEDGQLRLEKSLTTEIDPEQGILRVRVLGDSPAEAAALADAVTLAYLHELRQQRQEYLRRLSAAVDQERTSVRRVRAEAATLRDPRHEVLARDLQQARFELARARAALALEQERQKGPRPPLPATAVAAAIDNYLRTDALAQDYQRQIDRLEEASRRWEKITALGSKDPLLQDCAEQVLVLRKKLAQRRTDARAAAERVVEAQLQTEQRNRLNSLRDRIAALQQVEEKRALEVQMHEETTAQALRRRELESEVAQRQKELDRLESEQRAVERAGDGPAWVNVLGQSQSAPAASRQQRLRRAGLGGGFAFVLLLMALAWQDFRERRITHGQDVVYGLGLPLAGTLPKVSPALLNTLPSNGEIADPSRLHEAVDVLRTLVLRAAGDRPCVVLVTSAANGEGKTTLATQLAFSLARGWRKTLLIDGDLRRPVLHQRFRLAAEPGLSEVLRCEFEPADVVHPTEVARLWVLSAGHADSHALQALAQEDSRALFRSLKEQYDFIVLDASPVLSVADAVLLSQHADVVLLSARPDQSSLPSVHTAQERLTTVGAAPLGVVLVGTPSA